MCRFRYGKGDGLGCEEAMLRTFAGIGIDTARDIKSKLICNGRIRLLKYGCDLLREFSVESGAEYRIYDDCGIANQLCDLRAVFLDMILFDILQQFIILGCIRSFRNTAAKQYGCEGDLVAGENIAGFIKIADAMLAQGVAY